MCSAAGTTLSFENLGRGKVLIEVSGTWVHSTKRQVSSKHSDNSYRGTLGIRTEVRSSDPCSLGVWTSSGGWLLTLFSCGWGRRSIVFIHWPVSSGHFWDWLASKEFGREFESEKFPFPGWEFMNSPSLHVNWAFTRAKQRAGVCNWQCGVWRCKYWSLSCVQVFELPWTVTYQAPLSMKFCRPEYWSG